MAREGGRTVSVGVGLGIAAGVVFGLIEMVASAMMGMSPLAPLRMFASVVLGQSALQTAAVGSTALVGVIVHLALSGIYGALYALAVGRLGADTRTSIGTQAMLGIVYGVALWFVNFQIIAGVAYPWFATAPQGLQLILHALAFGLPLGLLYAGSERRAALRPISPVMPQPA